ncbi:MAG: anti-sigma factor family protein [Planctomycetota bacterium]|jgi:anti-sigma factor RsiW
MKRPSRDLLDLYIDSELSAREARQVEEYLQGDPEAREQVEAERAVRRRIGEVLRAECPHAPPGLEERVRRRLAERRPDIVGSIPGPPSPAKICVLCGEDCSKRPRVKNHRNQYACRACAEAQQARRRREAPASESTPARSRHPSRRTAIRVAAVIALVALSAFAVVFGLVGPRLDGSAGQHGLRIAEAADKVAGEHVMLSSDRDKLVGSLSYWTPQEAATALSLYLDNTVTIFDLTAAGYEFLGAGVCAVPNCDHACHVIYRSTDDPAVFINIHVVVDKGQFELDGLEPLRARVDAHVAPRAPTRPGDVVVLRDGALVYLLTANDLTTARTAVSVIRAET